MSVCKKEMENWLQFDPWSFDESDWLLEILKWSLRFNRLLDIFLNGAFAWIGSNGIGAALTWRLTLRLDRSI